MTNPNDIRKAIATEFRQYEDALSATLQSDNPLLHQVLDYIYSKRGKQLRPILVLLSAALCRGVTDKTIQAAVALEMMHTASLVHDDVVDDSPMRRGADAVHTQWTNKIAVLVGDYMLTRVMSILTNLRNVSILNIVSEMSAALTSGEWLQLHSGESMWISEEQYNMVIEKKTACLFAACSEAGAVSTGATSRQITALRTYGMHLGMCFQLKDDVLDYSDIEDIGKPTMNDVRDGKATLPLLISLQRASREEAAYIQEIAEALAAKAPHIDSFEVEQDIKSFILRHEGIRYAHQEMEKHRKKAIAALSVFPDNKYKQALIALLDYAINRMR